MMRMIGLAALAALLGPAPAVARPGGDTAQPVRLARCGGFLEGATVDGEGRLWVMEVLAGKIIEVLADGQCVERARTGGHANGARLGSDGKLYIADWSGLYSFDPGTAALAKLPLRYGAEDLTGLNDLAFDRQGGLYITVPGKSDAVNPVGRVFYRAPDGTLTLVSDRLAFPNGVAVSADGQTVLVSDFARKRIVSLPAVDAASPMKLAYVFAYLQGGIGADGMLIAPDGRVFAAIFGTRDVAILGADGKQAGSIALPASAGDWVTNIAIRGDTLYITEARKGEVWRTAIGRAPSKP